MINTVSVGPPPLGVPDLRSVKPDSGGGNQLEAKSTFAKALEEKISPRPEMKEKMMSNREETTPYEKPESEIKDKPPSLGISTKKTQLAREKEIQKFMDSFESEFGIPPTRLVEAMAQLKISDQQASPKETADQLMSFLPLDQKDQDRAKDMYLGFLFNLQSIEQTPRAPLVVPVNPDNLMRTQMTEKFLLRQDQRETLRNSLTSMNDKFWMKAPAVPIMAPVGRDTEVASAQKALTIGDLLREQEAMNQQVISEDSAELAVDPKVLNAPPSVEEIKTLTKEIGPELMDKLSPSDLQKIVKELRVARLEDNRNKELLFNPEQKGNFNAEALVAVNAASRRGEASMIDRSAVVAQESAKPLAEGNLKSQLSAKTNSMNLSGPEVPLKSPHEFLAGNFSGDTSGQGSNAQTKADGKLLEATSKKKSDLISDEATYSATAGLAPLTPLKSEVNLHGQAPLAPVTPQEKQENIQQIMNQAQYLVKKGGGEMKVKLSPEGLGEMHLKVMVENGKVNVQMSTESSEAKKLFESSVSDLKHSLSAHKLSIENVKVDVVNSTSTDVAARQDSNNLNSQGQFQSQKDTRQFWNQFQEQFGSRSQRDSFFDLPNTKGYGQKKRDPLTPLTEAQRPRRSDGRGSAIDVVA